MAQQVQMKTNPGFMGFRAYYQSRQRSIFDALNSMACMQQLCMWQSCLRCLRLSAVLQARQELLHCVRTH